MDIRGIEIPENTDVVEEGKTTPIPKTPKLEPFNTRGVAKDGIINRSPLLSPPNLLEKEDIVTMHRAMLDELAQRIIAGTLLPWMVDVVEKRVRRELTHAYSAHVRSLFYMQLAAFRAYSRASMLYKVYSTTGASGSSPTDASSPAISSSLSM